MESRRRVQNVTCAVFAAALLCAAAGVPAQTVHKLIDASGRITFTDQPATTSLARAETAPAFEVASALASNSAIASRRAAVIDRNEAARRLKQAQLAREHGAHPLPGELAQGSAASTVNHRYWRRQEKLRQAVELAQRRSNEMRQPQLAHR